MKKLDFFVLWMGTKCTLKCENCCNLIPYITQKSYEKELIVENIRYITSHVPIERLQIQGGEPLTNKALPYVLREINHLPINNIDIASNGTIMPNEELLEAMNFLGNKVSMRISDYACVEPKKKIDIEKRVREYGVNFYVYNFLYGSNEWFDSGRDNEDPIQDPEELKRSYIICENRHCWVLAGNHMACCGKILSLMDLRGESGLDENNVINITEARNRKLDFVEILKAFEYSYSNNVPYVCRYCKTDRRKIPAGIQMI